MTRRFLFIAMLLSIALHSFATANAQDDDRRRRRGDRGDRERQWDPRSYVKEIDRDKNGFLDKTELSGRMRDYLAREGHDTSKPVSLKRITKRYEDKLEAKANEERLAEREKNRVLPKFGTDEAIEKVPTFSESAESSASQQGRLEDLYEKEVVEMVRGYMKTLDTNKDGWLDNKESERIQGFLGEDADKDGNDRLGELEIAEAVKNRRAERGSRRSRGRRDNRDSKSTGDLKALSSAKTPKKSTPSTTKTVTTKRSRYARESAYVDSMFVKYDKDKDGYLSKDEIKGMSSTMAKKLVDSDGDKKYSREEATNAFTSQAATRPPSDAMRPVGSKSAKSGRKYNSKSKSTSSKTSRDESSVKYNTRGWQNVEIPTTKQQSQEEILKEAGARDAFLKLDKNRNGQVTMAEFRNGREWTDELAEEFYSKDKNEDGVLTTNELR